MSVKELHIKSRGQFLNSYHMFGEREVRPMKIVKKFDSVKCVCLIIITFMLYYDL